MLSSAKQFSVIYRPLNTVEVWPSKMPSKIEITTVFPKAHGIKSITGTHASSVFFQTFHLLCKYMYIFRPIASQTLLLMSYLNKDKLQS